MAAPDFESKTIELSRSTALDVTVSLMTRRYVHEMFSALRNIPNFLRERIDQSRDTSETAEGRRRLLRAVLGPAEIIPYEPDIHLPLHEKFKSVVGVGKDQPTISIGLTDLEMDYLNGQFLARIRRWQDAVEPTREELEAELVGEEKNFIDSVINSSFDMATKNRDLLMEVNLAWNRTGGTPRPDFLRFQETDATESTK